MSPKRSWHPRNKLAEIFTGALYQFSTVRKWKEGIVELRQRHWPAPPEKNLWLQCCRNVQTRSFPHLSNWHIALMPWKLQHLTSHSMGPLLLRNAWLSCHKVRYWRKNSFYDWKLTEKKLLPYEYYMYWHCVVYLPALLLVSLHIDSSSNIHPYELLLISN